MAVLNANKAFQKRKTRWPQGAQNGWGEAVKFFAANHDFLNVA